MVVIFIGKCFAGRKHTNCIIKQINVQIAFEGYFVILLKTRCPYYLKAHNFSSFKASSTLYVLRSGSFSIRSVSKIAATVSELGVLIVISNGIQPSRTDWRKKILKAVVIFIPNCEKRVSACAFRSLSMRKLTFDTFAILKSLLVLNVVLL